ncbi:ArsR/SmtB family transcription factor [Lactiplantibacillus pentosus]|jgi:DNA-binding transcriptional ArsR family regulator|uniref:ArsR/SmtB family transcription factor n=1 Tax=Lactiplantibacillus pentosus TaxID=1589 RepID=UPI000EAA6855|nr:metalloregulator ArsR/SmtB family transcription factor [Lactiplantibacillus pentosus]AYG38391.1 ArsR family transcriptional regulator [Lactiplantibacillus pentosus]AYG41049.1 ArsR family transcriptional regulator [Lactiplantibacillus pentosus]MCB5220894.1 metalloregulator ArsR/SmtB family transcription factor [Lactiplantibacillus pentosus]MCJ8181357.1 metalloregulator ArsR/SmtB family transcription factor [Lactiplantibacillus pentosus]MCS8603237.1 ArsR family transcriptional regulator [Lact
MIIKQLSDNEIRVIIFKALADEVRLNIVTMLYKKQAEMSCGEIGDNLDLNKSTASYHFKTLREAGLTTTRKHGQNKYVSLNVDVFNEILPGFLDTLA